MKITQSENRRGKKKNGPPNFLWDNANQFNIPVIGVLEEKQQRKNGAKKNG